MLALADQHRREVMETASDHRTIEKDRGGEMFWSDKAPQIDEFRLNFDRNTGAWGREEGKKQVKP